MSLEIPEGLTVRYWHERVYESDPEFIERTYNPWLTVSPHGGKTIARLFDAEDECVATGEATCRPDEGYNKRLGRTIALGRALKALERERR